MKKWYRIGICLVLIVCLLLLSACKGGQTPHADDPAQSTGQNEDNNDLRQNEENNTAGQDTTQQANGKVGDLTWNIKTVQTANFSVLWQRLYTDSDAKASYAENGDKQNIHRMNYAVWKDWADYQMGFHADCVTEGHCLRISPQNTEPCPTVALFQDPKYSEDYFRENTLLVLDIVNKGEAVPFAFKELYYADNSLTCTVERQINWWGVMEDHWCIFVEIGSVLPADVELKLEIEEYNDPRLNDLPKTLDFNWKETTVLTELFFVDSIGAKYKDSIQGYKDIGSDDKFAGVAGMLLTYESYEQLKSDAEQLNLNAFESRSYTKEFFESNSLVLVNMEASATRYEGLKDVRYENGVLTYYIQYDVVEEGEFVIGEVTNEYLVFIEVDTVLPEGIEIRREIIPT